MIVSATSIHFQGCENLHTLFLQNSTDQPLIYKMKITHTDLFSIVPGKGILPSLQKLPVAIKLNRLTDIKAKLLISHAQMTAACQEDRSSIDQQWAKIDKQHHQSIIILITRTSSKEPEEKKEEKPMFKKTESPLYEMEIKQQEKQESNDNNHSRHPEPLLMKSLTLKNNSNIFRSVEDLDKKQTKENIDKKETGIFRLQKQLEVEREKNKKMGERLIEKEKKITYLTEMRQMEVNRSLNREEEAEWRWENVVLGVLLLLMVGYLMSKYDRPYDFST